MTNSKATQNLITEAVEEEASNNAEVIREILADAEHRVVLGFTPDLDAIFEALRYAADVMDGTVTK
jgi:hypothetical protein